MLSNCEICNKEYYIRPSHYNRREHHYCSKQCSSIGQNGINNPYYKHGEYSESIPKICIVCGDEFYSHSSKTCSRKCHSKSMSDKNNPNWIEDRSGFEYGPDFNQELKNLIMQRDNFACRLCGITNDENISLVGSSLNIHHIDYDKKNSSPINLITLCKCCHSKTNSNRDIWKKKLQEQQLGLYEN